MRRSVGGGCPECRAYIITAAHTGIKPALPIIFPGCKVEAWQPVAAKLTSSAKKVFDHVRKWSLLANPGDTIKFTDISKDLAVTKDTLKGIRTTNVQFKNAVAGLDVEPYGANVYFTAYRKV